MRDRHGTLRPPSCIIGLLAAYMKLGSSNHVTLSILTKDKPPTDYGLPSYIGIVDPITYPLRYVDSCKHSARQVKHR